MGYGIFNNSFRVHICGCACFYGGRLCSRTYEVHYVLALSTPTHVCHIYLGVLPKLLNDAFLRDGDH